MSDVIAECNNHYKCFRCEAILSHDEIKYDEYDQTYCDPCLTVVDTERKIDDLKESIREDSFNITGLIDDKKTEIYEMPVLQTLSNAIQCRVNELYTAKINLLEMQVKSGIVDL